MVRSLFLATILVVVAVLIQTCTAADALEQRSTKGNKGSKAPKATKAGKTSNGGGGYFLSRDEFNSRLDVVNPPAARTMDQTQLIGVQMKNGFPFYGLQLPNHVSGQDDQSNFVTGDPTNANSWPDGAFSQLIWCADKQNQTLYDAMHKCGPESTCDSGFATVSFWGTVSGMDWVKDGLMLYQCLAIQTVKSQCKDPAKYPCKYKILEDDHVSTFPSNGNVNIIGSGATSIAQMAQQIGAYNQEHGTAYSLPSVGKGRRMQQRRLAGDDC